MNQWENVLLCVVTMPITRRIIYFTRVGSSWFVFVCVEKDRESDIASQARCFLIGIANLF